MKLTTDRVGDVVRLRMTSAAGRWAGVGVSAFVVRRVLIDSGCPRAHRAVAEAVSALGVKGAIITHWHEDHAGNVADLARAGIPIRLRPDTEAILRRRPRIQLYRRIIWGRPPALDVPIVPFETPGLEGIHTPGHSADHQVVWDSETGTLFSGDLWLGVRARVLHSAEDPYVIVESLRRAAALGPERMFDAHRGLVTDPVAALMTKAEWITETIGKIERQIAEGRNDRDIMNSVLGGEDRTALLSRGDYSRRNFVKAVRRKQPR